MTDLASRIESASPEQQRDVDAIRRIASIGAFGLLAAGLATDSFLPGDNHSAPGQGKRHRAGKPTKPAAFPDDETRQQRRARERKARAQEAGK